MIEGLSFFIIVMLTTCTALSLPSGGAHAEGLPLPKAASEPSVVALQRAAVRLARVEPERARSMIRRSGRAAILPHLRLRVGQGGSGYVRGIDGVDRYDASVTDSWHFEVDAAWSLDRLVFDHNEIAASREAQHLGLRREQLELEVAQLYFARRRAQLELERGDATDPEERALEVAELTAILDSLTGGALSGGRAARGAME